MKRDALKFLLAICIILFLSVAGFFIFNNIKNNSYVIGDIVGKYRNGDNNQTFHLVINDKKREKSIDITVEKGQYDKYQITDTVKASYSLLKEVETINYDTVTNDRATNNS